MSKPDWLKQGEVANVQTAIQSQTIQTALERNVSDLSPQALQSFLTNAPIPRVYSSGPPIGTYAGGSATTTIVWNQSSIFDPYGMMNAPNGIITVPIDGFYAGTFSGTWTGLSAGSQIRWIWTSNIILLAINVVPNLVVASSINEGAVSFCAPLRAGQTILPQVLIDGANPATISTGVFGLTWVAPFNIYQGGQ